jgi:hypothetical protein
MTANTLTCLIPVFFYLTVARTLTVHDEDNYDSETPKEQALLTCSTSSALYVSDFFEISSPVSPLMPLSTASESSSLFFHPWILEVFARDLHWNRSFS